MLFFCLAIRPHDFGGQVVPKIVKNPSPEPAKDHAKLECRFRSVCATIFCHYWCQLGTSESLKMELSPRRRAHFAIVACLLLWRLYGSNLASFSVGFGHQMGPKLPPSCQKKAGFKMLRKNVKFRMLFFTIFVEFGPPTWSAQGVQRTEFSRHFCCWVPSWGQDGSKNRFFTDFHLSEQQFS